MDKYFVDGFVGIFVEEDKFSEDAFVSVVCTNPSILKLLYVHIIVSVCNFKVTIQDKTKLPFIVKV